MRFSILLIIVSSFEESSDLKVILHYYKLIEKRCLGDTYRIFKDIDVLGLKKLLKNYKELLR